MEDWRVGMREVLGRVREQLRTAGALQACESVDAALREPLGAGGVAACAQALVRQQQFEAAEAVLVALRRLVPNAVAGHAGLGFLAVTRGRWQEALTLWDEAFQRFGECGDPFWYVSRATAATRLGSWRRAVDDWRRAFEQHGGAPKAAWLLDYTLALLESEDLPGVRVMIPRCAAASHAVEGLLIPLATALLERRCYPETALLLENLAASHTEPGLLWPRLHSLISLGRLESARAVFNEALREPTAAVMEILVRVAPRIFEDAALTASLTTLLRCARSLEPTALDGSAAPSVLTARLLLALRQFDDYQHEVGILAESTDTVGLKAVATALRRDARLEYTRRKVFGIGLSRTGTTSLAAALEILGHATAHWSNPVTHQVMDERDLRLFDAFADTPACMGFETHYYRFPRSQFIYTIRPPEPWERSVSDYFRRRWGWAGFEDARERMNAPDCVEYGRRFVDIHMTLYYNHGSYAEAYRLYDQRVRRFFADKPRERLLILDVCGGEGWEKLCGFLDQEVPEVPFPWHNRAYHA